MPLHVLNGDTTRAGLEHSGIDGDLVAWTDLLHEGPVPPEVGTEATIRVRAEYLATAGYGNREDITRQLQSQEAALARWFEFGEVLFWLEHDLFDQLLLLRHLAWLDATPGARERGRLICVDRYLGSMPPEALAGLFPDRQPISETAVTIGAEVWRAFTADDPAALVRATNRIANDELPFLPGALVRLLEEYPGQADGLSRSERQLLAAVAEGHDALEVCFRATQAMEERVFMGDSTFLRLARGLSSARQPLLSLAPMVGRGMLGWRCALTAFGRAVHAGRADHVRANGIDRWIGGVHLSGYGPTWRWSGQDLTWA